MQMSKDENNIITNLEYSLGNEKNSVSVMEVEEVPIPTFKWNDHEHFQKRKDKFPNLATPICLSWLSLLWFLHYVVFLSKLLIR